MRRPDELRIRIFADGADLDAISAARDKAFIEGFTTNPTLMRSAGIQNYEDHCRMILELVPDRPVSIGVLADDFEAMAHEARTIAAWGDNAYVKIPVTNAKGAFSGPTIRDLCDEGIKVNVTAVLTSEQVESVTENLNPEIPAFVSVFAGRIADTGLDPVPIIARAVAILARSHPNAEVIWASPREVLNVIQADAAGCHIITLTNDLVKKLPLLGKDLTKLSLETVRMFYKDTETAGYAIDAGAGTTKSAK